MGEGESGPPSFRTWGYPPNKKKKAPMSSNNNNMNSGSKRELILA